MAAETTARTRTYDDGDNGDDDDDEDDDDPWAPFKGAERGLMRRIKYFSFSRFLTICRPKLGPGALLDGRTTPGPNFGRKPTKSKKNLKK